MKRICAIIGLQAVMTGHSIAADLPVKAPVPYLASSYDWTGWYVGAHVGVIRGSSSWSSTPLGPGGPALNGAFDLPFNFDFMAGTGSYVAGLQGGYNYVLPSHLMASRWTPASPIPMFWCHSRCEAARRSRRTR